MISSEELKVSARESVLRAEAACKKVNKDIEKMKYILNKNNEELKRGIL